MKKTTIEFEDIKFYSEKNEKENQIVKARFLKNYYFHIKKEELDNIGKWKIKEGKIIIEGKERKITNKINLILDKGLQELKTTIGNKKCNYIHIGSEIPLIGSNEFGLVDRGSNIIEIKPLTGCNLSCNFCSVSEGKNDKKEILIQEEYIIEEFKKLVAIKKEEIEANIGPQGEPLLYPKIIKLIRDLKTNGAKVVSINTNGTLLNKKLIDEFYKAGLTRINLSIHTLNQEKNNKIMGGIQNLKQIKEMIKYSEGKIDILLAPVLMKTINDEDLDEIIKLAKTIKNKEYPSIGIQNFLTYKGGRNPGIKERTWEEFFKILKEKEKKHKIDLTLKGGENYFQIKKDKTLEKPFKKNEVIKAEIIMKGRTKNTTIAKAKNRIITIKNTEGKKHKIGTTTKIKILRDKHNIYTAV